MEKGTFRINSTRKFHYHTFLKWTVFSYLIDCSILLSIGELFLYMLYKYTLTIYTKLLAQMVNSILNTVKHVFSIMTIYGLTDKSTAVVYISVLTFHIKYSIEIVLFTSPKLSNGSFSIQNVSFIRDFVLISF